MSKRQLASDVVLNELLLCGGEWKTRKAIFDELIAEGHPRQRVDFYLFSLANHQPSGMNVPSGVSHQSSERLF